MSKYSVVKTQGKEYVFLHHHNAERFAGKLTARRIRVSICGRYVPGDDTDEEYWMRHDGKDYSYDLPIATEDVQ